MSNYSKYDIILIRYPFTDLSSFKVRPAVIISNDFENDDLIIIPITSKRSNLILGEFPIKNWRESGLNVISVIKKGIFTIDKKLVLMKVGKLLNDDIANIKYAINLWIG